MCESILNPRLVHDSSDRTDMDEKRKKLISQVRVAYKKSTNTCRRPFAVGVPCPVHVFVFIRWTV